MSPWLLRNVSLSKSTQFDCTRVPVEERSTESQGILGGRANNVNHFTLGQPGAAPTRQAVISLKTAKVSGVDFTAGPRGRDHRVGACRFLPRPTPGLGTRCPRFNANMCDRHLDGDDSTRAVSNNKCLHRSNSVARWLKHLERLAKRNVASCPPGGVEGGGARVGRKKYSLSTAQS